MNYLMHLTVEELQEILNQAVSAKIQPLERAIANLTERSEEELLKIDEVCAKLHVSDRTIRNWVKSKKIKCHWIHNRQYFMMKDVIACMTTNF